MWKRDVYGFNEVEMRFILSWLVVHQPILHSWGDTEFFSCCDSVLGDSLQFHHEIEVPYVFDWEHGTPQQERQGNRASSWGKGEVSWVFSSCGRHLVYILELQWGWPFETRVSSAKSGLLSSYDRHLRKLNYAWQENCRPFWRLAGRPSVPY